MRKLTRRDFFRRSVPIVAAAAVAPTALAQQLYTPKKYWDMGVAYKKGRDRFYVATDGTLYWFGEGNRIMRSFDGVHWEDRTPKPEAFCWGGDNDGPAYPGQELPGPPGIDCTHGPLGTDMKNPPVGPLGEQGPPGGVPETVITEVKGVSRKLGALWKPSNDIQVVEVSLVKNPPHGHRFQVVKEA